MVLALPVFGQDGEDGVFRHLTPKLFVQPVGEKILGVFQQRLSERRRREEVDLEITRVFRQTSTREEKKPVMILDFRN